MKYKEWRNIVSKYVIISNLTDEGARTLKKNAGRIKEVNKELKDMGVNVTDQYAVLGNFDFISIVEAENDDSVMKAVIEIASRGSIKTATYKVVPIDEFIESFK
ncbi:Glutamine synthetase and cystathionine beta-lyase binding protein [Methanosarcinales archaeon]|nr:Glutamine synthetase and cystathionine beta-lyase binding protein [Methanosarcinales archaeon]